MFYSHEILTSRKHGVATIWLMATLGSKSGHKKITRKAIMEVNLPRACNTVTQPDQPLALRLQGSLLVGISRVYGQQCEYMMQDTENLRVKMKKPLRHEQAHQIDPSLINSRPEQLNLPYDPTFNVDIDLGLDVSIFDFSTDTSRRTSIMSPHSQGTSQSSLQIVGSAYGSHSSLLPFDVHPNRLSDLELGNFDPIDPVSHLDSATMAADMALHGQDIYDDLGMHVDEDGQLIFADDPVDLPMLPPLQDDPFAAINTTIRSELQQPYFQSGEQVRPTLADDGNGQQLVTDNEQIVPLAESTHYIVVPDDPPHIHEQGDAPAAADTGMTTMAGASQRRARASKPIQADLSTELNKTHLETWQSQYLENMSISLRSKLHRQSTAQAKRTAAFWILDQGIGGVQVNFGNDAASHPLAIFSGQSLLDALESDDLSRKRPRDDSDEDEQGKRSRVRSIAPEHETRGGQAMQLGNEDGILTIQDDMQPESEVGRRAEGSLKDHSSQMPWHVSSRQGSSHVYGSALYRASSLAGSVAGVELGPPSNILRRQTRLTSASPLFGKGRSLSHAASLEGDNQTHLTYDIDDFDDLDRDLAGDLSKDFELYGPAAGVSTQQAAETQWITTTLENEGRNFLDFLKTSIEDQTKDEALEPQGSITFSTLLPTAQNSQIVAAQALLHILTLATKGFVTVEQEVDFGDITFTVVR